MKAARASRNALDSLSFPTYATCRPQIHVRNASKIARLDCQISTQALGSSLRVGQGLSTTKPRQSNLQRRAFTSSLLRNENKRTPLYDHHVSQGAKMVPFAGFDMPLEYKDQSHPESHKWTRQHASLFDVSHMVQHKMSGELAEEFLAKITPSSFPSLEKHSSTLSCLLSSDPSGGIVDDTVITRIGKDSFYFVTNAGCRDTDLAFIQSELNIFLKDKHGISESAKVNWHVLDHHSLLALQGPSAQSVLQKLVYEDEEDSSIDYDISSLYFGHSRWLQLHLPESDTNTPSLLISRTGYTGEDGFEISIPPESGSSAALATSIAKALTANDEVRWAGLAARDSLRLEAGMCLYGHDITINHTPPQAGLGWIVAKDRRTDTATFNGAATILEQLGSPKTLSTRRVGLTIAKGPAAREGAQIVHPDNHDEVLGTVTSGCPSPTLNGQNIAMGYVKNGWHKRGTKLGVKIRKKVSVAEVTRMPFVDSKFYRPDLKGAGKDEAKQES